MGQGGERDMLAMAPDREVHRLVRLPAPRPGERHVDGGRCAVPRMEPRGAIEACELVGVRRGGRVPPLVQPDGAHVSVGHRHQHAVLEHPARPPGRRGIPGFGGVRDEIPDAPMHRRPRLHPRRLPVLRRRGALGARQPELRRRARGLGLRLHARLRGGQLGQADHPLEGQRESQLRPVHVLQLRRSGEQLQRRSGTVADRGPARWADAGRGASLGAVQPQRRRRQPVQLPRRRQVPPGRRPGRGHRLRLGQRRARADHPCELPHAGPRPRGDLQGGDRPSAIFARRRRLVAGLCVGRPCAGRLPRGDAGSRAPRGLSRAHSLLRVPADDAPIYRHA
mmetsp:Transcript_99789/g.279479  ORF Transcript_99789/g.279479 Transcript_99789/m.279479 type:complete len:337 (-) Transcript_99789:45-1055(-)